MPGDLWLVVLIITIAALIIGTLRMTRQTRARPAPQPYIYNEPRIPVRLHEVIEETLRQLETPIALGLVDLMVSLQDGTADIPVSPVFLDAFRTVLQRAIARAAGGSVLVSAQRSNDRVQVTVSDDGKAASADGMMAELRGNAEALALQGGSLQVGNSSRFGNVLIMQILLASTERAAPRPAWLRAPATRPSSPVDLES